MKLKLLSASLALGMVTASPAQATTALTLEITNALNTWLQVAEVKAFNASGTNVAAAINGGTAIGALPGTWNFASTPAGAINGVIDSTFNFSPAPGDLTMYHPSTEGGANALIITFASLSDITSIDIFGRADCCSNRDIFGYRLFDGTGAVVASGRLDASNPDHFASVSFAATPAVPEPATWAMMIIGMGMVGFAMRKRGNVKTTVAYA